MDTVTLKIPISKSLKKSLDEQARVMGFSSFYRSVQSLLSDFARKRAKSAPEVVKNLPPETKEFYADAIKDIKAGRNITKTKNLEELLALFHSKMKHEG